MLIRVIAELRPAYLAVSFDLPLPTFRHETYLAYQAHRPSMEQELKSQVELVREVVEAAGIPVYTTPGFEADDVIGTLARQALQSSRQAAGGREEVAEVVIVTGDRDILQLVDDRVKVYAPVKGLSQARLFDKKAVEEYMGIKPKQIVDYKALVGDQSDNYPGVRGVGPKTAVEMLRRYETLDGIFRALGSGRWALGKKIAERLKNGQEAARLSQKLARISTSAPVTLDLARAKFTDFSRNEKFIAKIRELGFKSLLKRLVKQEEKRQRRGAENRKKAGQMELV
jgi:DNA polymerase-1